MDVLNAITLNNDWKPSLETNWEALCSELRDSSLSGDFYYRSHSIIPNSFQEYFQREWLGQNVANTLLWGEIYRFAGRFEERGVRPVLLKGPSLHEDIYEDIGQRAMSDVDLLVLGEDFEKAFHILIEDGYELKDEIKWKANDNKADFIKKNKDGFYLRIELHKTLYPRVENWDYQFTPAKQEPYYKLGVEDHLVFLIYHLAYQHTFQKLHWLVDIDRYLRVFEKQINWEIVEKKMRRLKIETAYRSVLFACSCYLRTPVGNRMLRLNIIQRFFFKTFLTPEFLVKGWNLRLNYYFLKHFLKGSFIKAFEYNLLWGINNLQQKLKGVFIKGNSF